MRFSHVDVSYRTLTGEEKTASFDDPYAVVIQHECDHLAGITLIERMQFDRRSKLRARGARI
jgi:peptide deformylase